MTVSHGNAIDIYQEKEEKAFESMKRLSINYSAVIIMKAYNCTMLKALLMHRRCIT